MNTATFLAHIQKTLEKKGLAYMRLKVTPNAVQTEFGEVLEGREEPTLKLRVAAVPEKGKANKKVIQFVEQMFPCSCEIVGGKIGTIKLLKLEKR